MKFGKNVDLKQGIIRLAILFLLLFIFCCWVIINGFVTGEIYHGLWRYGGSENVWVNLISQPERFYFAVAQFSILASGLFYGFIWAVLFYRKNK